MKYHEKYKTFTFCIRKWDSQFESVKFFFTETSDFSRVSLFGNYIFF